MLDFVGLVGAEGDTIYVWSGVWQSMGWGSIIYIAALSGVSPELHEAAIVDGATKLQRVFHVDIPIIIPTAVILLIMNMGHVMSVGFEKVYLWYRRTFSVPEHMAGKRILLRFGAVDYSCDVYINGHMVGCHHGGYTPFAFDITDYMMPEENDICVHVEDRYDCMQPRGKQNWKDKWFGCWYTPVSGIWQTVYLEAVSDIYLTRAHITPDIDKGQAHIQISLNRKPVNPILAEVTVRIGEKTVRHASQSLDRRNQRLTVDMISGEELRGFEFWTPDKPSLYDVTIRLECGDEVHTYFGMRKIEVKDGYVLLNNHPLYQRLVLDQGYWPQSLMTPPSDEMIRNDVEWTKKLGFNGARKHQKMEDPQYYYWADKLGLLVWGEVPSAFEFTNETINNLYETLSGFIDRDYNHPCIITWVPFNESWGITRVYEDKHMQATACMMYYQAKALDGTRLVSSNDGWEQVTTDIVGLHDYAARGEVLAKHFEDQERVNRISNNFFLSWAKGYKPTGHEAVLLTEYGGIAMEDESGQQGAWGYHEKVKDEAAFFARYQSVTDAARAILYCQGYCYTQLTDVQQEVNGLLTADRKPKVDVKQLAAITRNPEGR